MKGNDRNTSPRLQMAHRCAKCRLENPKFVIDLDADRLKHTLCRVAARCLTNRLGDGLADYID